MKLSAIKQQLVHNRQWRNKNILLNNELRNLRAANSSLETDLREVTTLLETTKIHTAYKTSQMINNEQRLSEQFENLANRIFEQCTRRVNEQNCQNL